VSGRTNFLIVETISQRRFYALFFVELDRPVRQLRRSSFSRTSCVITTARSSEFGARQQVVVQARQL
jgi:hypothetical protein